MASTINRHSLPRDPCRSWGGEKENQIRNLRRFTRAPDWVCRFRVFEECRIFLLVHAASPMQIRYHDAGVDGIDPDTFCGDLQRCATGQLIDCGLADAVSEHPRKRAEPG